VEQHEETSAEQILGTKKQLGHKKHGEYVTLCNLWTISYDPNKISYSYLIWTRLRDLTTECGRFGWTIGFIGWKMVDLPNWNRGYKSTKAHGTWWIMGSTLKHTDGGWTEHHRWFDKDNPRNQWNQQTVKF
jgi:hypothetical protein